MADKKYAESRAGRGTWVKLHNNQDGTYSVSVHNAQNESDIADLKSKLDDVITKLTAIEVHLSGTLDVSIV